MKEWVHKHYPKLKALIDDKDIIKKTSKISAILKKIFEIYSILNLMNCKI